MLQQSKSEMVSSVAAARELAICLKSLPPGESDYQRCVKLALEGLRQARLVNFKNVKLLETEAEWEPLRSQSEFQDFLAKMKADLGK